ncbi:uncharacterized protein LOC126777603 [Nymphalis io]|uniref:uncharacterized protein LOC126777603 n=1 Tax=Inachis io TaxID=171585 RepID=UPI002168E415|nr:uncharacterized protein LOC126777603 [Nymphalis io]
MMGSVRGARPPSHTAYYVALAGVLTLLLLLCCYFIYFCIRRVKELAQQPLPEPVKSVRPPPPLPKPVAYPVQPGVRESATAMARLCQLPPAHTDTVFPRAGSLPAPRLVPRGAQ